MKRPVVYCTNCVHYEAKEVDYGHAGRLVAHLCNRPVNGGSWDGWCNSSPVAPPSEAVLRPLERPCIDERACGWFMAWADDRCGKRGRYYQPKGGAW